MEENNTENVIGNTGQNGKNSQKQIAGAIIIAGVLIAGAVLLKGTSGGQPLKEVSTAKEIGLKIKPFEACVASGKFSEKVQADIDDGIKAGVNGTPTSFILKDGVVVGIIEGAQPSEKVWNQIVDVHNNDMDPLPAQLRPVTSADHMIGSPDAKIIIVEYSDLDCPFCKSFHSTMHEIINGLENSDVPIEIAWVYRHYPIPQLHPGAFKKAEETECAWEQGGNDSFWKYTDRLFGITSR